MPLPTDEGLIALSEELLQQLDTIFGLHPGMRPAHAKGALLTGTFTPAPGSRLHHSRPSYPAGINPGDRALLELNRPSADFRQRSQCESARNCDSLPPR